MEATTTTTSKTKDGKKVKSPFFFLLRYVGEYKKYAFLCMFTVTIEAVLDVLIPTCQIKVLDILTQLPKSSWKVIGVNY